MENLQPEINLDSTPRGLLERARELTGRIGLSIMLATGIGLTVGVASELAEVNTNPAAADTGGYPWDQPGAVDLSSTYLGKYTWGYTNCLDGMNCGVSATINGNRYYYRDNNGYDIKNCTSYVAWKVNKEFGVNVAGWGNADTWDDYARSSYTVDNSPEPGDIAVWDSMHVAFVESVNGDGSANVSQYNRGVSGTFSYENNRRADHYIDINGTGNIWNGSSGNSGGSTGTAYSVVGENEELTDGSWVYSKVGGASWPIKPKSQWTASDTNYWGNDPKQVSTAEIHDHEVGYDVNGNRVFGAHPPRDGTDVYIDGGNGQQYYFLNGKAYSIGIGEIDDLGVRNKAQRIPGAGNRLDDFTYYPYVYLPNGAVYRFAGGSRVNQMVQHPDGGMEAYYVNNDTVLSCLGLAQRQPIRILPQSAQYYLETLNGIPEIATPTACQFPSGMVLRGPGGLEQWRITGDNGSQPYQRHYYSNALLTYLHTNGSPDIQTLRSVAAINGVPQGADMAPPQGAFFRSMANNEVFESVDGQYRKALSADMLQCLGNPPIINVPGSVMEGMPQGASLNCDYEHRIMVRPNGQAYYVEQSRLYVIGNPAVRDCIIVRKGTGSPTPVTEQTLLSYADSGLPAHCAYEQEPGINFVREGSDPTVWLVHGDGTKQHVGSLCVADAFTTVLKKFHVWSVPVGETGGHRQTGDWFADPTACAQLPG